MGLTAGEGVGRQNRKKSSAQAAQYPDRLGLAARQAAHRLLGAIVDAHTPMDALCDDGHGHPQYLALDMRDRQLTKAILMTALRHRADFLVMLDTMIAKPLPAGATSVSHILQCALAQILFLDIPDHSAVDLAVEAAQRDPRSRRFASLVNAVTRRATRQRDALLSQMETARGAQTARVAPDWFQKLLVADYGADKTGEIAAALRHESPVDLAFRAEPKADRAWVEDAGGQWLHPRAVRFAAGANSVSLTQWPGFDEGDWWVQDAAAGIPAMLMGDVAGLEILDACAAPGGKTAQLLDGGARVTALDLSANRLRRLEENLARLGLASDATVIAADIFKYAPEKPFDAVLLDAPCSSTGTIRRHPDVPWVKTEADIEKLADLQARMLRRAASLVRPGGVLVFSNCSLLAREGEEVVAAFLADNDGFVAEPPSRERLSWLPGCVDANGFIRTTPADLAGDSPGMSGLDGFFAARLVRKV